MRGTRKLLICPFSNVPVTFASSPKAWPLRKVSTDLMAITTGENILVANNCYQGLIADSRLIEKAHNVTQPLINIANGVQIVIHQVVINAAFLSHILYMGEVLRSTPGMVCRTGHMRQE